MKKSNDSDGKIINDTHNALKKSVADALEKKKKLGQYCVMWKNGDIVVEGNDAPKDFNSDSSTLVL